jgi:hypothetical protein
VESAAVQVVTGLRRRPAGRSLVVFALLANAAAPALSQEQLGVPRPQWGAFFSGKDRRVPIEPAAWPWQAIGRVNVADRVVRRYCTGTLVGPRLVLTAGHCLYDFRLGRWAKPAQVHFVAGLARDASAGHSTAVELIVPPDLDVASGFDPRLVIIRNSDLIARDWAATAMDSRYSRATDFLKWGAVAAGSAVAMTRYSNRIGRKDPIAHPAGKYGTLRASRVARVPCGRLWS